MIRRSRSVAVVLAIGLHAATSQLGDVRLAQGTDVRDPHPRSTAGSADAAPQGARSKAKSDRAHQPGDTSSTAAGPHHDPPTGNARESGPGSGAGL